MGVGTLQVGEGGMVMVESKKLRLLGLQSCNLVVLENVSGRDGYGELFRH